MTNYSVLSWELGNLSVPPTGLFRCVGASGSRLLLKPSLEERESSTIHSLRVGWRNMRIFARIISFIVFTVMLLSLNSLMAMVAYVRPLKNQAT